MPRGELTLLTPEPGTTVGGKYRILRLLGEGGMGAVYEAENTLTLKRAAIKWLHPRLIAVDEAGKRLLNEARAMARVRHRNVVDIYDVVIEQSSVFLVMELLIGEQLSALLARETISVGHLISLLLPAMRGVAAAHAAGVIHRDIKPDNIFLVREPGSEAVVPKVIDFGISRFYEDESGRLTRSGMTMGTPRYVSYEQLRGMRDVDHRTDIYAFGVILYECLVGHPPYRASSLGEQAISFVTTEPPRPIKVRPELPEALDRLVYAAIAKHRDGRPASMELLIEGLLPFVEETAYPRLLPIMRLVEPSAETADVSGGEPSASRPSVAAKPAPSIPEVPKRAPANWRLFGVGAMAMALLLAALVRWVLPSSLATHRAEPLVPDAASLSEKPPSSEEAEHASEEVPSTQQPAPAGVTAGAVHSVPLDAPSAPGANVDLTPDPDFTPLSEVNALPHKKRTNSPTPPSELVDLKSKVEVEKIPSEQKAQEPLEDDLPTVRHRAGPLRHAEF